MTVSVLFGSAATAASENPTYSQIESGYLKNGKPVGAPDKFIEFSKKNGVPKPNTCAVRLSMAIKASRKDFFEVSKLTGELIWTEENIPTTAAGLGHVMAQRYGKPPKIGNASEISGKKGVVFFDKLKSWPDGTGHISLWDGAKIADTDGLSYFKDAERVYFWELK